MLFLISAALMALISGTNGQITNGSIVSGSVVYDIDRAPLARNALGFSIGPISVTEVVKSNLTSNLLGLLGSIAGTPIPIRIGGSASDKIIPNDDLNAPFELDPEALTLDTLFISKEYFDLWSDYFPEDTPFTYTLNFANSENSWGNATIQAQWAINSLGNALELFELGDSPDHYAYLAYRNASTWNSTTYATEVTNLTNSIVSTDFYRDADSHPLFQAGGFADPPALDDQQWENDDLDVVNVTKAGLKGSGVISSYGVHLFPEANTPPVRKAQISLDLLSDHDVVYRNLSQYKAEVQAAASEEKELVISAAGTVAGGASGVSDTFGAALWGVDFVLTAASLGISKTFFHFDGYSPDSPIIPTDYQYRAQNLTSGVRANFYTSLFLAHTVSGPTQLSVGPLPDFNSSDLSGFALFDDELRSGLQKLVFVDLNVFNSSNDLWNSASQSRRNSTSGYLNQTRGTTEIDLTTPWSERTQLNVVRLEGPGTNARSGVRVAGQQVDSVTGDLLGSTRNETLEVGPGGGVRIKLKYAEAILIEKLSSPNNGTNSTAIDLEPVSESAETTAPAEEEKRKKKKNKKSKKNGAKSLGVSGAVILLASTLVVLI